jgi:hypothetical protein
LDRKLGWPQSQSGCRDYFKVKKKTEESKRNSAYKRENKIITNSMEQSPS